MPIREEADKEYSRDLLIKQLCGEANLSLKEVCVLIHKFVLKKDDPFALAREIAERVSKGMRPWDIVTQVRLFAPDAPKEELWMLAVDIVIKAIAITIAEEKLFDHEEEQLLRDMVVQHYLEGIMNALPEGIDMPRERLIRMISIGVDYHLILLGKEPKKKSLFKKLRIT